jgi:tetratricopeptide (TPR) repeat protein/tRNA A-37 threonylcarbamoyl transferase component Bud32
MTVLCPKCQTENAETALFCSDCGTKLGAAKEFSLFQTETLQSPLKELNTGSTFANRYQIIEELGKGGMGKVYKVFDTKIREKIALKLIKPEIASDRQTIERFSNELKLARKVRHKNVCGMFDIGEAEGAHFITMEYVGGEDLKTMIRMSTGLTIGTVLSIGRQVCHGLAEAHSLGVVHRDLKPQNIIIDKGGNAKIMDFGIARSMREKGITGGGIIIGTPEYMSPEQTEAKEVDQRSDIYSLGVILYEMATGRVPFEGESAMSVAIKHKTEIPKDPKTINPHIPDDLRRLILRCLEKDKAKRYQSAAEVEAELEKIEKGIPTTERIIPERAPLTSREITVKFTLRKLLIPGLGIITLAIVALFILRFLPKHRVAPPPTGKPTLAILYFENISGDKSLDPWKTALPELLITKLSQSKFISVLDGNTVYSILKKLSLDEAKKYTKEDLLKIANEGKATYTLSGSLMKAGPNFIMTLSLQKPHTGEVVSTPNIECKGEEEIFPKVDELAKTIKSDLKLTPDQIASDFDKEVGRITTSSAEAYKYYAEARKQHVDMKYPEAIELFQKAVSIDPGFAMAYRGMAVAYGNMGYVKKQREAFQKAMGLIDRVSERERYVIQGSYYMSDPRTYDKAIETFNKLLELYPDDVLAPGWLGNIYDSLEEWDKALKYHEMEFKVSKTSLDYANLGSIYERLGFFQKAREVYEDYLKNISDSPDLHRFLGRNYLAEGKFELARVEADKAFLIDPKSNDNSYLKAAILFLQDDLAGAGDECQKLLEAKPEYYPFLAQEGLATIDLRRGNFGKAIEHRKQQLELSQKVGEKAWEARARGQLVYLYQRLGNIRMLEAEVDARAKIDVEENDLFDQIETLSEKSTLYLEKKSLAEASTAAEEMKKLIDSLLFKKQIRFYFNQMGTIELGKNDLPKAIQYFENAVSLDPASEIAKDVVLINDLGSAYFKNGDLDKARQIYEKINSQLSSKWNPDIYITSFYMLGRVAEQQGDKVKAAEYFQKFLDLWKDADPGILEVKEARERLNKLKAT